MDTCAARAAEQEYTLSAEYKTPSATISYTTRLIATTGASCSHEDVCNNVALDGGACSCLKEVTGSGSVSTTFKVRDLFDEPCVDGEERVVSFFLHYAEADFNPLLGSAALQEESPAVKLSIDLLPPAAPTEAPVVLGAEEALRVTVAEVGGDASSYEVCVREAGYDAPYDTCERVEAGVAFRFEGLANDTSYDVVYAAYDEAGNRGAQSPAAQGTPASVLDFAEVYSGLYPGGEEGGCASSPARPGAPRAPRAPLALLALLALLAPRAARRAGRRAAAALVAGAACLAGAGEARAEDAESERSSTVTLRGGSYLPAIDSEFQERGTVQRPYERVFKNDAPLMFLVQADRHLLQAYGTLAVGAAVGYWNAEGEALSSDNVQETTEMSIYPLSLSLSYRFDLFQRAFPVTPVLRGGLSYYLWNVYDGAGETARFAGGGEASGGTLGWHYAVGLQLLLDSLDREMAWSFDRDAGVNHSYLTVEYQVSQVDDFGSAESFRLGGEGLFVGLALDL
ncbi:MAG: hypothetical protein FJ138_12045 [Deltaproteobacteria bacterium]|nr:hypothetical protein [Deltaproteobacteria bacterium]